MVDDAGKTYRGSSNRPENYLAFGKPILAASDGIVVDVRNDIKDYHRAGMGWVDIKTPDIRGNYVVIRHDSGRYTLYAHLKAGSITVKEGEAVVTGQKIENMGIRDILQNPIRIFNYKIGQTFILLLACP